MLGSRLSNQSTFTPRMTKNFYNIASLFTPHPSHKIEILRAHKMAIFALRMTLNLQTNLQTNYIYPYIYPREKPRAEEPRKQKRFSNYSITVNLLSLEKYCSLNSLILFLAKIASSENCLSSRNFL